MPSRSKASQPTNPTAMPARNNKKRKNTVPTTDPAPQPAVDTPPPPPVVAPTPATQPAPPKAKRAKKAKVVEVDPPAPTEPMQTDTESTVEGTVVSEATTTATTTTKKKRNMKKKNKKTSSRTPSSYVLFSMEHRKKIVEESPDMSLGEVSKQCGGAWKALSEDDKKPWVDKANELKQKRMLEIEEIMKNEPPKKKRTPSSYLLFAMEHRKVVLTQKADMSIGEVSKMCGAAWKALDDAGKTVWKDKAAALKNNEPVAA